MTTRTRPPTAPPTSTIPRRPDRTDAEPSPPRGRAAPRPSGHPFHAEPYVLVACDAFAVLLALSLVGTWSTGTITLAVLVVGTQAASGAYTSRLTHRLLDDIPRMLVALSMSLLMMAPLIALLEVRTSYLAETAVLILALPLGRLVGYVAVRHVFRRLAPGRQRVVIVGGGQVGRLLAVHLVDVHDHGLLPIGYVDVDVDPDLRTATTSVPYIGHLGELDEIVARHRASRLIVADPAVSEAQLASVLRQQLADGVEVHVVPRLHTLGMGWGERRADEVAGVPLVRLRPAANRRPTWVVKRIVDVVGAFVLLTIAAPVLAGVALAVRLGSPGPVLFRQQRIGRHGRTFELLKFRSMRTDHDQATWSVAGDTSVTPIGRILRRTSIDELPQLLNVLRGDMSLVGPRPERPQFARRFSNHVPGYADRHRLPVGLTGWAQVSGLRGDTSIPRRAAFDNAYADRWSLWFDVVLLLRTITTVVGDITSRRQA